MRKEIRQLVEIAQRTLSLSGPVLEVGSLQVEGQESIADMRPLFSGDDYIGFDMRSGKGVDQVEDICCWSLLKLPPTMPNTILCLETLEHIRNPFVAVENMSRMLNADGIILITTVMNFKIHNYPEDYFRFTPRGLAEVMRNEFGSFQVFFDGEPNFPKSVCAIGSPGCFNLSRYSAFSTSLKSLGWSFLTDG